MIISPHSSKQSEVFFRTPLSDPCQNWNESWIYILSFWCVRDTEEKWNASILTINFHMETHTAHGEFFVCLFVFKGKKLQLYAFLKYQEMYLVLVPFFFYSTRIDLTVIQTRNSSRNSVSMSPLLLSTMGYWCIVNK